MEKIYYADKSAYPTSEIAVLEILKKDFGLENAKIFRGDNGKRSASFDSYSHIADEGGRGSCSRRLRAVSFCGIRHSDRLCLGFFGGA